MAQMTKSQLETLAKIDAMGGASTSHACEMGSRARLAPARRRRE